MPHQSPQSPDGHSKGTGAQGGAKANSPNHSIRAILCPSCTAPISPAALQSPHPVCDHCGVTLSIKDLASQRKSTTDTRTVSNATLEEWLRSAKKCVEREDFEQAEKWLIKYQNVDNHNPDVWWILAINNGEQGLLDGMRHGFEKAIDLMEPDEQRRKMAAKLTLKYARMLYSRLPKFLVCPDALLPSSQAALRTYCRWSLDLNQIINSLEYAEQCDPSDIEITKFIVESYTSKLDQLNDFFSKQPGNSLVTFFKERQQLERIETRRDVLMKRIHQHDPSYQGPTLRKKPAARQSTGCGCMVVLAVTLVTAVAYAAAK